MTNDVADLHKGFFNLEVSRQETFHANLRGKAGTERKDAMEGNAKSYVYIHGDMHLTSDIVATHIMQLQREIEELRNGSTADLPKWPNKEPIFLPEKSLSTIQAEQKVIVTQ